jgi:hypothetical protein
LSPDEGGGPRVREGNVSNGNGRNCEVLRRKRIKIYGRALSSQLREPENHVIINIPGAGGDVRAGKHAVPAYVSIYRKLPVFRFFHLSGKK